jgi:DNA mismatch repair ATPase MutS
MTKNLLARAAERYREKYELSNHAVEDFQQAIGFLNALRRIHVVLNERDEAEEIKKKTDVWTAKLKEDVRKKKAALDNEPR